MKYPLTLLAILLLAVVGCGPSGITRTYDKPIPSQPPPGMVRIVPQKIHEDGKTVHWRWTIVGDRNWTGTAQSASVFELTGSYPLAATDRVGGTNAYECDLIITAADEAEGRTNLSYSFSLNTIGVRLTGAIQGSVGSGGGVSGSGGLWSDMKKTAADQAARALLIEEQTFQLPLDKPLLEVKGEGAEGKAFQRTYSIKISE